MVNRKNLALDKLFKTPYRGNEKFSDSDRNLDFTVLDFWSWSNSNLLENTIRGVLAEFIVARALNIETDSRVEWESTDLSFEEVKIEVKSSAYIQAWEQKKLSTIQFSIAPTHFDNTHPDFKQAPKRHSDIYIFCLFKETDPHQINPLDLSQWEFFVLATQTLNERVGAQKSIGLNSLKNLDPKIVQYDRLQSTVRSISSDLKNEQL
ncbi:MAG: hypothetical protein J7641_15735 [Cyanobacteria bacterium SID2]|nr:hypothetical protein [Cyanobacteria bacterium SID2]